MKKLKTLFNMDYVDTGFAVNEVREESAWVMNGEGVATIKFDGTSCLYQDGKLWKRYDRNLNKRYRKLKGKVDITLDMVKEAPECWVACEDAPDPKTGHFPGWLPISSDAPEDKWHREGLENTPDLIEGRSYELVGPRVAGNLYNLDRHILIEHGSEKAVIDDLSFEGLKAWLFDNNVEGIVWHHPDGRMVKLRRKDFGIPWGKSSR